MRNRKQLQGITLVELMVVLLIVSILASIAIGVYVGYAQRARFAAAKTTIHELELAAARYEVDLGEFPPSSSGTSFDSSAPNFPSGEPVGCGYLMLCLLHSYNGNATAPLSNLWAGPYLEVDQEDLVEVDSSGNVSEVTSSSNAASISLVDPWGNPYVYQRNNDYAALGATEQTDSPYRSLGEVYYNPATVQIYSRGPDGTTPAPPLAGLGTDDINNFHTR